MSFNILDVHSDKEDILVISMYFQLSKGYDILVTLMLIKVHEFLFFYLPSPTKSSSTETFSALARSIAIYTLGQRLSCSM